MQRLSLIHIYVLLMKKYSWGPEGGAPTIEEIPDSEKEKALEMQDVYKRQAYSGVSLDSFIRKITFQEIKPEGIRIIGPAIAVSYTHLDVYKRQERTGRFS